LVANLYLNDKPLALLCTSDTEGPLTRGQVSLFQHIRDLMELAITSSIRFGEQDEVLVYYVDKLVCGLPVDERTIRRQLAEYGWDDKDEFRVHVIADSSGERLSEPQLRFCLRRIDNHKRQDTLIVSYDGYVVVLTKRSKRERDAEYRTELERLLRALGLICGYSQVFESFYDLPIYYAQSLNALKQGLRGGVDGIIWGFDDLYFQSIVSLLGAEYPLKSFCHPDVLSLHEFDNAHGTDFVCCLRTYLSCGCNMAQTGKTLFMHRNTLAYRLERIAGIIGRELQRLPESERMQLWFSCLICEWL
jgi:DNA-binding PucR family transcriptional regulator